MSRVVTAISVGGMVRVHSPFSAKDLVKALPASVRRWDKSGRYWEIVPEVWPALRRGLTANGYEVLDLTDPPRPKPPRPTPKPSSRSWVRQAFEACQPELRPKLRKSLSAVFHPDVHAANSTELATEINTTFEALK